MPEFVIEIPHSPEECSAAAGEIVRHPRARDLVATTYWGCSGGVHSTWIVAEFEGEDEASALVPRLLRDTARVVPVERGTGPGGGVEIERGEPMRGGPVQGERR